MWDNVPVSIWRTLQTFFLYAIVSSNWIRFRPLLVTSKRYHVKPRMKGPRSLPNPPAMPFLNVSIILQYKLNKNKLGNQSAFGAKIWIVCETPSTDTWSDWCELIIKTRDLGSFHIWWLWPYKTSAISSCLEQILKKKFSCVSHAVVEYTRFPIWESCNGYLYTLRSILERKASFHCDATRLLFLLGLSIYFLIRLLLKKLSTSVKGILNNFGCFIISPSGTCINLFELVTTIFELCMCSYAVRVFKVL